MPASRVEYYDSEGNKKVYIGDPRKAPKSFPQRTKKDNTMSEFEKRKQQQKLKTGRKQGQNMIQSEQARDTGKRQLNLQATVDSMFDEKTPMKKQRLEDSVIDKDVEVIGRQNQKLAKGGRAKLKGGGISQRGLGRAFMKGGRAK
jgi:hypothetical protein